MRFPRIPLLFRSPNSLALVFIVVGTVRGEGILANNVDPNNLGQGDWIWEMPSCESALGVSTPQAVIDYAVSRGMQWVAVKAGDGVNEWAQWNTTIINEAHAKGMKIFAWVYAYGNYTNTANGVYSSEPAELNVAKWALSIGGDGLIIDAESEYQGQGAAASAYASGIKAAYPNLFLAYAPFPYISYHSSFPYIQFGRNCDAVMPQAYWADIGVSVTNMVYDMDGEWSAWQSSLTGLNTNAIKPIIPIGQGWSFTGYTESTSEVTNFAYLLANNPAPACLGGYHGISYWECSQHPAAVWKGMTKSVILAGTNGSTVPQGSRVVFAVNLPSGANMGYQWKFDQADIAGATNSTLMINNVQAANAGSYAVRATNANGCAMTYSALLSVVSPLVNTPDSVLAPPDLVNWWPMDAQANDIYGVTNATPQNGVEYTRGEVSQAIHLDGATGFLNTGAAGLTPPWTVCLWINRQDAPGPSAALFSDTGTNVLKLEQYNGARKVGVTVQGVADYTFPGGYSVPQNIWTHLVFVDDGSQIQLYANGSLQGALAVSFPLPRAYIGLDSFIQPDALGSETSRRFTDYLRGSLDEVQIFDRALGASEISAICHAGGAGLVRAPELNGIARVPGGIQLNLRGQTGKSLTLYSSTDLANWSSLGTFANPGGAVLFLDMNSLVSPQMFYRASQP